MSSWQLPVASDLIDRVFGEIFGPISRLIRRDIQHDVDSIRWWPGHRLFFFFGRSNCQRKIVP